MSERESVCVCACVCACVCGCLNLFSVCRVLVSMQRQNKNERVLNGKLGDFLQQDAIHMWLNVGYVEKKLDEAGQLS